MRGVETRDTLVTRELVVQHADGEHVLVAQVTPLRGANRSRADIDMAAEGAVAVVRDVTELRRLELARQEFFGNVSHELKTPITAIRGSLETIVDDPDMQEPVRARFLDSAVRHAARLNALVNDLLALARLEGDPGELHRAPLDLAALAGEIVYSVESSAVARGVTIVLNAIDGPAGADNDFVLVADEEAMRQAISNLVSNAIAYSEAGSRVELQVRRSDAFLELDVRDQGCGIPADAIERIFERFYRVDAARSREIGGTGIGLSIVKHVAQAHGGSVDVTSELGMGSSFIMRFPVSRSDATGTSHG